MGSGLFVGSGVVRQVAAQDGDALDQFGEALQRQQREADRQEYLGRPQKQAAGVSGEIICRCERNEVLPSVE